jgi:hypothetical protein
VRERFKDDAACRSTAHRQSNAMVGTRNHLSVRMRPITVPRVSECGVSSDPVCVCVCVCVCACACVCVCVCVRRKETCHMRLG